MINQNKMTAKEKAIQLIDRFSDQCLLTKNGGKVAALIAVDEILDNFGLVCNGQTFYTEHRAFDYYSEVKQELIKSE